MRQSSALRLANLFIRLLFGLRYNDVTKACKGYRANMVAGCRPFLSPHFNLTVELPLKAIVRGYSYEVVPISWRRRKVGVSRLKLQEMGSRYLFNVLDVWLEKWLPRGDYRPVAEVEGAVVGAAPGANGPSAGDPGITARSAWLATLAAVGIVLVGRGYHRLTEAQFWAEDGRIFFQDAYNLPFWAAVTTPYAGQHFLLSRLLAELALLFRVELVPTVLTLCALAVGALCCSVFVLDHFAWLVPRRLHRVLFCLGLAALPASDELLLRFLNCHWYLGLLGLLLVLADLPASRAGRVGYVAAWAVLATSAVQTLIFLPWLLFRAWGAPAERRVVLPAAALLALAVVLTPATPLQGAWPEWTSLAMGFVNVAVLRVLVSSWAGLTGYERVVWAGLTSWAYLAVVPYLVLQVLVVVARPGAAVRRGRAPWPLLLYATAVPALLPLVGRPYMLADALDLVHAHRGERYFVLPIAAIHLAALWWATTLVRSLWPSRVATLALVLSLLPGIAADFEARPTVDRQWALHARRLKAAEAAGQPTRLSVPLNPERWTMRLTVPGDPRSLQDLVAGPPPATGYLDYVGAEDRRSTVVRPDETVRAWGWALSSDGQRPAREVIVADEESGRIVARTRVGLRRPDVAAALGSSRLRDSGFDVMLWLEGLAPGDHTLRLYVLEDGRRAHPVAGESRLTIARLARRE